MSKSPPVGRQELRRFGLSVGLTLAGLFGLFFPWLLGRPLPLWPWAIAVLLVGPALVWPWALKWPHQGWRAFAAALGYVNTRIILAVIYFLVFTPMGLLLRLLGRRDPMNRRLEPDRVSYRIPSHAPPARHMERPF